MPEQKPVVKIDILADFKKWVTGRTGLSQEEFVSNYSATHHLTPQETESLKKALQTKEPEKPTATAVEPTKQTPVEKPKVSPELIIQRTPYPKWWNDEGIAKIALTSPGSQFVITARGDYDLYIATIVFTVSGDCDIVLSFGQAGSSGSMNFGGTDEPRGIVIAAGNSPTPCGSGSFMITANSDEPVSIGGYVAYYLWKKPTP